MQRCMLSILILAGCFGCLEGLINWYTGGKDAAASSAIASGDSMYRGSTGNYRVICTVITENWTKYPLKYPGSHINGGRLASSPVTVQPGKREKFVAHKTPWTATGSYGTASWLISNGEQKRAVVMWECPYSFDFHDNWLAVGLTDRRQRHHQDWYRQMWRGSSGSGLNFVRDKYDRTTNTISYQDFRFEIVGTMGTAHHATARIIVRPLREEDLAPAVKNVIDDMRR